MGYHVPRLRAESLEVDDDGVHYKEGEPGEEIETEEDNIGRGRRVEEEGEEVHPGSEGHSVRDEQEDNGWEDGRV